MRTSIPAPSATRAARGHRGAPVGSCIAGRVVARASIVVPDPIRPRPMFCVVTISASRARRVPSRLALAIAVLAAACTAKPRESRVNLGDASLYTREIGAGPPIVVLHGGPDFDHRYLLPDLDRMATGYRLIYYDQRGRGRSAAGVRPEDVTLQSEITISTACAATSSSSPPYCSAIRGAPCLRSSTRFGTRLACRT